MSKFASRCSGAGLHEQMLDSFVWSAAWLRGAEVDAAAAHKITLYDLMQRAGRAAFNVFRHEYPLSKHWLVLCGSGNNGGDGFEIARLAADANIRVTVVSMAGTKPLPPEASAAREALLQRGGISMYNASEWHDKVVTDDVDLVVDGLLGTGIGGAPRKEYSALIDCVNALGVPRVAIDIPSGLNAETGAVEGECIRASHTVTFIALKPGLFTGRARDFVGKLHYNCLDVGQWMLSEERKKQTFCRRLVNEHLKQLLGHSRPQCSHKGANGKVLLLGGDFGFGGAIVMAAEAALRTGAGLVRVITRTEHVMPLMCRCPEVMAEELTETSLRETLEWATCVAVGPGLGQREWGQNALARVLSYCQEHPEKPSVWDADALNIMASALRQPGKEKNAFSELLKNRILTPHPGEAARLLRCTVAEVERDRFLAARRLAECYGGIVLLKGAGTVLCAAENIQLCADVPVAARDLLSSRCVVADVGNSGMATGGMGDVLTGIIAGLLAQRLSPWHAACAGCVLHGASADLAACAQGGERGLTATSLFKYLPACVNPFGGEGRYDSHH